MALANYADLLASVASYLHRDDLSANIPDFVVLAEARISRDLRIRKQIVTTTLTMTAGVRSLALPDDWLELENLTVNSAIPQNLTYMTVEQMDGKYAGNTYTARPAVYTIEGDSLLFGPTPDAAYPLGLIYYAKFPALATASVNFLMTSHPSLYLFATLAESAPFIADDARAGLWDTKYRADMAALQQQDERATHSGSALRVKTL
jgi:hypothetical protein